MQLTEITATDQTKARLSEAIAQLAREIQSQPAYERYMTASRQMYGDPAADCAHSEVPQRLYQARVENAPPETAFCDAGTVQAFMEASTELMSLMTAVDRVISDMLDLPLAGGLMPKH